ncbi:hypothetical protein NC653_038871 [Populus alba x Populus x berolinensis]|uniref:Uncharacterized protein n=1 Tax=Populus alba x Populus x berolinensis TaxID=444605 RepID=A0AAD6LCG0_9ROSI|nr:hypothetical protein NC653_038871 [Populus alba x Populus x berolinensis]
MEIGAPFLEMTKKVATPVARPNGLLLTNPAFAGLLSSTNEIMGERHGHNWIEPIANFQSIKSRWRRRTRLFHIKISGEWDGFGADFTTEGKPTELPESVVPEAYREWETQCPTLAHPQHLLMAYKTIKLLPTIGCEADAATRYSLDERVVGGVDNNVSAFEYQSGGSYAAV